MPTDGSGLAMTWLGDLLQMKDIALHLMDLFENSAKAGASLLALKMSLDDKLLSVKIEDNGPGFPKEVCDDPVNPYSTTRKERKVGLGLSLFDQAARQTGGGMFLGRSPLGGVLLEAKFNMNHPDAKSPGDIEGVIISSICAWHSLDFLISVSCDGESSEEIDTRQIKAELEGVPLQNPEVLKFISSLLEESFSKMRRKLDSIEPDFSIWPQTAQIQARKH